MQFTILSHRFAKNPIAPCFISLIDSMLFSLQKAPLFIFFADYDILSLVGNVSTTVIVYPPDDIISFFIEY